MLLEVNHLSTEFKTDMGSVQAVRDVSFTLNSGEVLGIVGESGCGKSAMMRSILGLLSENGQVTGGSIVFDGQEIGRTAFSSEKEYTHKMNTLRGSQIGMVFQDPMTFLNPSLTIGAQIEETILNHNRISRQQAAARALELLKMVGIHDPEQRLKQYPFQLSGGMRQRIIIAIAIANEPKLIIADEPTTALDVTVQAQVLNILKDVCARLKTSIIFITHDLGIIAELADRVAVMYAGKIVEYGQVDEIFYHPQHPYTWGLLQSIPQVNGENKELYAIPGNPPDLHTPPVGDAFYPRNPYALNIDAVLQPPFFKVTNTHYAATWLLDPRAPKVDVPEDIRERYAKWKKHY
ncbi:MAG: ABC transporter ATP-binding protein [Lachnospiraceae bacterium]|nr:ABC transporter ATP-binding protein [Lachnospiraceae bacterium]